MPKGRRGGGCPAALCVAVPSGSPRLLPCADDANLPGPESIHAFVDACRGLDAYNGASATVGLRVVQTLDAMYRSAKSGKPEDCW